jgi:hypothetical protein
MKAPALIEIRYKPYSNLDYISGFSYLHSTKDLPSWKSLLTGLDDENNEVSIRILPISDLIIFAYDAFKAAEEHAELETFYEIVGEEVPTYDYRELGKPIEFITEDDEEEVVEYTVMITPKAEKELLQFYYTIRELPEE